jgi:uncharacterized protein (TIGR02145 family)
MKKNTYLSKSLFISLGLVILFASSCNKESEGFPELKTLPIEDIDLTSVLSGGVIEKDGGSEIIARGVCWSADGTPSVNDFITEDGSGSGSFTSTLTGLTANTRYLLRSYATNKLGTAYGDLIIFRTGEFTDIDGNVYRTVTIGDQVWTVENLRTTRYNDGTPIPHVTDNSAWASLLTPAYCWSNNDEESFKNPFGALYNWHAVNSGKLCPEGWHVPTQDEWYTQYYYWSGDLTEAGAKLKESGTEHWTEPNTGADNESGFTALPGIFRSSLNGQFGSPGNFGYYWSADEISIGADSAWSQYMAFNSIEILVRPIPKGTGIFVRCIKD